jgi:hypothetical protein
LDAARKLAELLDGGPQLIDGLRQDPGHLEAGAAGQLPLRAAQAQREGHEPLLRTVVEVALDPAALLGRSPSNDRTTASGLWTPPCALAALRSGLDCCWHRVAPSTNRGGRERVPMRPYYGPGGASGPAASCDAESGQEAANQQLCS